jgi:selenide,water dikinase
MRHRARGRWIAAAIDSMLQSSRDAAHCVTAHGATACTDVTGFGLLGHLVELLRASSVNAQVDLAQLPVLGGAEETVGLGFLSSLQSQNIRASRAISDPKGLASEPRFALLFDPQTAGGLLAGIPAAAATACLAELRALGYTESAIIGTVVAQADEVERVRLIS